MTISKDNFKSRSRLFKAILVKVCSENLVKFGVTDLKPILDKSPSFLWGHSIDKDGVFNKTEKKKKKKGNPYFIWEEKGRYSINPDYKNC